MSRPPSPAEVAVDAKVAAWLREQPRPSQLVTHDDVGMTVAAFHDAVRRWRSRGPSGGFLYISASVSGTDHRYHSATLRLLG